MPVAAVSMTNRTYPSPAAVSNTNLIWCVDAANRVSYSGSGTTVNDLTTSARNGTLTANAVYSTTNNAFQFDGTTSYITASLPSTSITNMTIQAWARVNTSSKGCIFRVGSTSAGYSIGIGSGDFDTVGNNVLGLFPGIRWIAPALPFGATGWHLFTMVLNATSVATLYVDTTSSGTVAGTSPLAPATAIALGRNVGDEPSGVRVLTGFVKSAFMYNVALNSTDITNNYNALARREGLI